MLTFDKSRLAEVGIVLQQTANGFRLHSENTVSAEAAEAFREVVAPFGLDVSDQDRALDHVLALAMWSQVRQACERTPYAEPVSDYEMDARPYYEDIVPSKSRKTK